MYLLIKYSEGTTFSLGGQVDLPRGIPIRLGVSRYINYNPNTVRINMGTNVWSSVRQLGGRFFMQKIFRIMNNYAIRICIKITSSKM